MLKVRYKDIENKNKNMKKTESSYNFGLNKYGETIRIDLNEILDIDSIPTLPLNDEKCFNCEKESNFRIKKFKPIDEQLDLEKLDDNYGRCSCGKRHIDIAMAQILKIMKEESIEFRRFVLRNGPIPLLTPMYSNKNEPYIRKKSLIILHPKLTKNIAKRILDEVSEVKGIIKGDPNATVGLIDVDSEPIYYELLAGSDIRCDIVESPKGKIFINKIQHLSYLEFPPSMENKIRKLWEYIQAKRFSQEEISKLKILDGTCGNGTHGIFLLKLGVKKVVFNDIWKPAAIITSLNLKANEFEEKNKNIDHINQLDHSTKTGQLSYGKDFEVYNLSLEELRETLFNKKENKSKENKFDICILDCFPEADISNFEKIAKSLAKEVFII